MEQPQLACHGSCDELSHVSRYGTNQDPHEGGCMCPAACFMAPAAQWGCFSFGICSQLVVFFVLLL